MAVILPKQMKNESWRALAKPGCKKCFGRGILTHNIMSTTKGAMTAVPYKQDRSCGCALRRWDKMTDDDRRRFIREHD